jgi:hypothetical protein
LYFNEFWVFNRFAFIVKPFRGHSAPLQPFDFQFFAWPMAGSCPALSTISAIISTGVPFNIAISVADDDGLRRFAV